MLNTSSPILTRGLRGLALLVGVSSVACSSTACFSKGRNDDRAPRVPICTDAARVVLQSPLLSEPSIRTTCFTTA